MASLHAQGYYEKNNQREVTQKVRKGQRSFLHAARRLDLTHIALKFYLYIPYCHRVVVRTRIV